MTPTRSFSLYELVSSVRRCIEASFSDRYWIRAESSDVRTAGSSGHCYLELIEKDETHQLRARVRANIWKPNVLRIAQRFRQAGLPPLASGMSLLCLVELKYHEQYGLSLIIHDVDPSYSLGEVARLRRETIARLTREGVLDLNKEHDLPRPLQRLAIISSPTAAGLEDFLKQIHGNRYGLRFYTALFRAQMQGDRVTESVQAALERIARHLDAFDAVVIIRGGGAVSELRAFDSYELCYYCTQFPLPIIVGVGHERDVSVLDMVAHTSLKTPTAVAEFLIHRQMDELGHLEDLRQRLLSSVRLHQTEQTRRLMELSLRLPHLATRLLTSQMLYLTEVRERLASRAQAQIASARRALDGHTSLLPYQAKYILRSRSQELDALKSRIKLPVKKHIERMNDDLLKCHRAITLADPAQIVRRGFAIVERDGKSLTKVEDIASGDQLRLRMHGGTVDVTAD